MDIKKLEQATKKLEAIKKLDQEIIEIDRMALKVADGKLDISIILSIIDPSKPEDEAQLSPELGIYGLSSVYLYYPFAIGAVPGRQLKPEPASETKYKNRITDVAALQILGVLLAEKHALRNRLIHDLQQLGVKIH